MRSRSIIQGSFVLVVLLIVGLSFVEANAQRRNKRSRRLTNPVTSGRTSAPPATSTTTTTTDEPAIISTAEDQARDATTTTTNGGSASGARTTDRARAGSLEAEHDTMRGRMNRLSAQVTTLTEKLTRMEEQQRTLVDLERLSRAEQRAEGLRAQLRDVQMKEADLQGRADQLDFDLKPENIERTTANTGSVHPEEAREARRRQLQNEMTRVRAQLDLMAQSRARLETAIATADAEADRIRQRLGETQGDATQAGTGDNNNSGIEGTSNTEAPLAQPPPPSTSPSGTPR